MSEYLFACTQRILLRAHSIVVDFLYFLYLLTLILLRDELIRLRTTKAPPTERRDAGEIPPEVPVVHLEKAITKVTELVGGAGVAATNLLPPPSPPPATTIVPLADSANTAPAVSDSNENSSPAVEAKENESKCAEEPVAVATSSSGNEGLTEESTASGDSASAAIESDNPPPAELKEDDEGGASKEGGSSVSEKDYDSDEAVGKEEAAKTDQGLEDEDDENIDVQINPYDGAVGGKAGGNVGQADATNHANKVTEMFQRLLNISEKESGQMVAQVAGDGTYDDLIS